MIERFESILRVEMPELELSKKASDLETYRRDESKIESGFFELLAFPTTGLQVQKILTQAQKRSIPVTPVGARTGKSGGSVPLASGLGLSLEKMNQILEINEIDMTATVQPGVVTHDLKCAVEAKNLFYPPDPNSLHTCTLGGNIAENSGGPNALKYGVTGHFVLGMNWVLPDGTAIVVGSKTMKGVAGYDVKSLLVGSEGTLGIATEITLKLIPKPQAVCTALAFFSSTADAAQASTAILNSGILPRALELFDEVALRAVKQNASGVEFLGNAALLIELDGFSQESLMLEMQEVEKQLSPSRVGELVVAQNDSQREKIWQLRRGVSKALWAMAKFKISEDVVVPRSKMVEAISRVKSLGKQVGFTVATYGHAGDGNLHTNVLFDSQLQKPKVDALVVDIIKCILDLGGTISGEHGIGLAKRELLLLEQSQELISLQKQIKKAFDPLNLMNPGKIFLP